MLETYVVFIEIVLLCLERVGGGGGGGGGVEARGEGETGVISVLKLSVC